MSYNIKLSDYALLPKKSIPLDARSHFPNFAQANKAILGNVATVETADEIDNDYKQFYVGQIITTTTGNTWKVSTTTLNVTLYIDYVNNQIKWGSENNSAIIDSFKVKQVNTNLYAVFDGNDQVTENFVGQQSSVGLVTCLIPFSGSGGGGGATLKLTSTAPINVDNSNNISLSLDNSSALTVNKDNQLTLGIGPGIKTVNNQITLSINENSNLSIIDDKLSISGTHFYQTKSDDDTTVPENNYIYQEI